MHQKQTYVCMHFWYEFFAFLRKHYPYLIHSYLFWFLLVSNEVSSFLFFFYLLLILKFFIFFASFLNFIVLVILNRIKYRRTINCWYYEGSFHNCHDLYEFAILVVMMIQYRIRIRKWGRRHAFLRRDRSIEGRREWRKRSVIVFGICNA